MWRYETADEILIKCRCQSHEIVFYMKPKNDDRVIDESYWKFPLGIWSDSSFTNIAFTIRQSFFTPAKDIFSSNEIASLL